MQFVIQQIYDRPADSSHAENACQPCRGPQQGYRHDPGIPKAAALSRNPTLCTARQRQVEKALANCHLQDGALIPYDVSSSCVAGKCRPLAAFGCSRSKKRVKRQIVLGLLCSRAGMKG